MPGASDTSGGVCTRQHCPCFDNPWVMVNSKPGGRLTNLNDPWLACGRGPDWKACASTTSVIAMQDVHWSLARDCR